MFLDISLGTQAFRGLQDFHRQAAMWIRTSAAYLVVLRVRICAELGRMKDCMVIQGQLLVPWCLPNTADRHNGWRGLFGRLDWRGHFPTSVTDPQPMGKVGQVFHPDQDRIVSVRECARAQVYA